MFERRDRPCACCGENRGWIYVPAPYADADLGDRLCPWCIADGSAATRFGAVFTIVEQATVPSGVTDAVVDEVASRTPGFAGWQQERWLFHCDDAAGYLGPVGWDQISEDPEAIKALTDQAESLGFTGESAEAFVGSLDVDGSATGYLFRCLHCGKSLAYADFDDE